MPAGAGTDIFKPGLNGFSCLKGNLETLPEKESVFAAPMACGTPEQGARKKIWHRCLIILGMILSWLKAYSWANGLRKVINFKICQE